jgi:hypothetical protein
MSDFIEAGKKQQKLPKSEVLDIPNLKSNEHYSRITKKLQTLHAELLRLEHDGKLSYASDNPALISDYLGKIRLNCNMLFSFLNTYIDIESDLLKELNEKRTNLYQQRLAEPKGTPSAAETHSRALTRLDETSVKIVQNRIQQIKNEFERYNGICMYLQSKMKEHNTDKMMLNA